MNVNLRSIPPLLLGFAALFAAGQCGATFLHCEQFISSRLKLDRIYVEGNLTLRAPCEIGAPPVPGAVEACVAKLAKAYLPPDKHLTEADIKTACEYANIQPPR